MAYVLGYIVADGCICVRKDRKKHPYSLNITSVDKEHLERIKKAFESGHKVSKKSGGSGAVAYQLQIPNPVICGDLMSLGVLPRKTYNLGSIQVPDDYFSDFVRGFFDGDGSVYIYTVNRVSQIKGNFASSSLSFIDDFNLKICKKLGIISKTIHEANNKRRILPFYYMHLYISDCEKLAEFMYGGNPELYLPRKRQVFEKWKTIERRHYIKQNYPSKIGWRLNEKVS